MSVWSEGDSLWAEYSYVRIDQNTDSNNHPSCDSVCTADIRVTYLQQNKDTVYLLQPGIFVCILYLK